MILTKNINYKKASLLIKQCKVDSVNYIHDDIGYNYSSLAQMLHLDWVNLLI